MDKPWSVGADEILAQLKINPNSGLSSRAAAEELTRSGRNRLTRPRNITFLNIFWEEIREPMILLLLVVAAFYIIWGETRDAVTIIVVISLLVLSEIFTEYRAKKAVYALRKLSSPEASVLREGRVLSVATENIVPGDIVLLKAGDRIPADARIIESLGLEVDEAALTGESLPVVKFEHPLPPETALAERNNMLFSGTTVTRGRGKALVTATGMRTELGRITGLVLEAKEPKTTLQLAMKQLSGLLVWVALFFSLLIPAIGLIQGKSFREMILTGLSLSFATIPEELPIIITMVLGVGALAWSRRHVLIKKLRAAETLGVVTVIVTDKTGTLTENKMKVAEIYAGEGVTVLPAKKQLTQTEISLLRIGAWSSAGAARGEQFRGDPLELALVQGGESAGIAAFGYIQLKEFSFDNERKMMSVVLESAGETLVFAKGAPEVILAKSTSAIYDGRVIAISEKDKQIFQNEIDKMAAKAFRVVGLAYKKVPQGSPVKEEEAESGLIFAGIAGLADPPRVGVKEALQVTRAVGIRTIVVSGDHPLTVSRVASEVGLDAGKILSGIELEKLSDAELKKGLKEIHLFARTSPEEKLRIVKALQEMGEIVAVTGDGINDAPALKTADIGIAMGETGTEVARETADMILTDDSFTSVAAGVEQGRKILDNLRKGVTYYLAVKVALVTSFLVPLVLGLQFPFAPIQIILLELFMDLAASATFVAEPIEPDAMRRQPGGRQARFVGGVMIAGIISGSLSLAVGVLFNYLFIHYSGGSDSLARSTAFATWLIGHVYLALSMRSHRSPFWILGILSNPVMLGWAAITLIFLVVITTIPALREVIKVEPLGLREWLLSFGVPSITIFWMELRKALIHHRL